MERPGAVIAMVVFLLGGLGLLAGGVYWYFATSAFLESAQSASGEVIDVVRVETDTSTDTSNTSSDYSYRPVIAFEDAAGKTHEFQASQGSNPPSYSEGDAVDVLYDPDTPSDASINSFFSLWGGPIVMGGIGLVFTLVGAAAIVLYMVKGVVIIKARPSGAQRNEQ